MYSSTMHPSFHPHNPLSFPMPQGSNSTQHHTSCLPSPQIDMTSVQSDSFYFQRIGTSVDDSSLFSSLSHIHSGPGMPHSSPSSLVCSPATSPIPVFHPPSPTPAHWAESPSPSPSPPHLPPSVPTITHLTSPSPSRPSSPLNLSVGPSSPLFPSVGPSPSSGSPTNGCYSPATSPFPTPTNTPRPSICATDSGHSEMELDSSPMSDTVPSLLLEIRTPQRKSVEDVLRAVKEALDSVCPQVNYQCQDTSFRLNGQSDLQMELQVCSGTDGHVPGLQVRKLSGDNLEYTKLCNHLLACVNY